MTKEEAIKLVLRNMANSLSDSRITAEEFVDTLAALGVLKLEEPRTPWNKFVEGMVNQGHVIGGSWLPSVKKALNEYNLKIVENT